MADVFLGTALLLVVVVYLSLSAIGTYHTQFQIQVWWSYARIPIFLSVLLIIAGCISFFYFLAALEVIKFPVVPLEQNCTDVSLTLSSRALPASEHNDGNFNLRVGLQVYFLPLVFVANFLLLGSSVEPVHQAGRGESVRAWCWCGKKPKRE